MKNALTTISGILAFVIPILNIVYKMLNGGSIGAEDISLLGLGTAAGHGLYQARDARTVETTIVQPMKQSGPTTIEKTI